MDELYNDQPYEEFPVQYRTYPFMAKLAPETIRSRVRRGWTPRMGPFTECCQQACTYEQLRSYCKRNTNNNNKSAA